MEEAGINSNDLATRRVYQTKHMYHGLRSFGSSQTFSGSKPFQITAGLFLNESRLAQLLLVSNLQRCGIGQS